jgi:hypothetical protein
LGLTPDLDWAWQKFPASAAQQENNQRRWLFIVPARAGTVKSHVFSGHRKDLRLGQ